MTWKFNSNFIVLILLLPTILFAQKKHFTTFNVSAGLLQDYVYDIQQDNDGNIYIATGEGINILDGTTVRQLPDSLLSSKFCSKILIEKDKILIGHQNGTLTSLTKSYSSTKILVDTAGNAIVDLAINSSSLLAACTQKNVYVIENLTKHTSVPLTLGEYETITCLAFINDRIIALGTTTNLYIIEINKRSFIIDNVSDFQQQSINNISKDSNDELYISTDKTFYKYNYTEQYSTDYHKLIEEIPNLFITSHYLDKQNNVWLTTYSGLIKLNYQQSVNTFVEYELFDTKIGIKNNFVKSVFVDRESNLWIGYYGQGLDLLNNDYFSFYSNDIPSISQNTRNIYFDDNRRLYAVDNGLIEISDKLETGYAFHTEHESFHLINDIILINENHYLLATENGLYNFEYGKEPSKIKLNNELLSDYSNCVVKANNFFYIGTKNGLFILDTLFQQISHLGTTYGMPHNNILDLQKVNNQVWVGTPSNKLTVIENQEMSFIDLPFTNSIVKPLDLFIDNFSRVWIASYGDGVFVVDKDSIYRIHGKEKLYSDYCYSINQSGDSSIWVGHKGGLTMIQTLNKTRIFDHKDGIESSANPRAMTTNELGELFIGTDKGVIRYNPKNYLKKTTPPAPTIETIKINGEIVKIQPEIVLAPGAYKIEVHFNSISFKFSNEIQYSYYLSGFEDDWSELDSDNRAIYHKIANGNYKLMVRSCFDHENCTDEISIIKIIVKTPFYKKWWFYLLCLASTALIIYLFVSQRIKKQKEIQLYLETELNKRTKEVVQKNDELEEKNKDITDSIKYAKKIQTAILSPIEKMREEFPESFIFFNPRDIVSGDFYWFDKIDDLFIILCADCTGHGVPGAFMSMICSTITQEAVKMQKITDPGKMLEWIDHGLVENLKQDKKQETYDGMDCLMMVINKKEKTLTFAGAGRPLVFIRDGKLEWLKTDRHAVGGHYNPEKQFETFSINLEKGDQFYTFSDGYQDQFGDINGKKIGSKRIKELLLETHTNPMRVQESDVRSFFNLWKSGVPQIDDVVFMGIKVD